MPAVKSNRDMPFRTAMMLLAHTPELIQQAEETIYYVLQNYIQSDNVGLRDWIHDYMQPLDTFLHHTGYETPEDLAKIWDEIE